MVGLLLIAIAASFGFSAAAFAQAGPGPNPVPLTDAAKNGISGDWVRISAVSLEEIEAAQASDCNSTIFDEEEMRFVWAYDEEAYSIDIPALTDASGHLAFRWNEGWDLYIADAPSPAESEDERPGITVYRAADLRMQTAPGKLGVSWAWVDDVSPTNEYAKAIVNVSLISLRNYFLIEQLTNNTTGQSFLLLAFPTDGLYQREPDSKLYVKCP